MRDVVRGVRWSDKETLFKHDVALPSVWGGCAINAWNALQMVSHLHYGKAVIILSIGFVSVCDGKKLSEKHGCQGREYYCLQVPCFLNSNIPSAERSAFNLITNFLGRKKHCGVKFIYI